MSITKEEALAQVEALAKYLHSQGSVSKDAFREILAALSSPCETCGGGNVLADGLINGWVGEREGNLGMLSILVDYDSVGSVQLDNHVRIIEVKEAE